MEIKYSDDAIYSLKDYDCEYKGKTYPSIRKLYMEMCDPTEYEFATKYFLNWDHWKRITENKLLMSYIQEWRDELEVKLRSRAVKLTIANAEGGNYQAAKWLADRGWNTRGAGRPTKGEVERQAKIEGHIANEYGADVIRLRGT